jgi:hypothetical protein
VRQREHDGRDAWPSCSTSSAPAASARPAWTAGSSKGSAFYGKVATGSLRRAGESCPRRSRPRHGRPSGRAAFRTSNRGVGAPLRDHRSNRRPPVPRMDPPVRRRQWANRTTNREPDPSRSRRADKLVAGDFQAGIAGEDAGRPVRRRRRPLVGPVEVVELRTERRAGGNPGLREGASHFSDPARVGAELPGRPPRISPGRRCRSRRP